MLKKRLIPLQLAQKQIDARADTQKKIREAIEMARSLGKPETNQTLVDLSGLSVGVFYKKHIKPVLTTMKWGNYNRFDDIPPTAGDIDRNMYVELQNQVKALDKERNKLLKKNSELIEEKKRFAVDNNKMNEEAKILRGQIWVLQKKLEMFG